ncbi:MAG: P-II family nitrogen regulator [Methanomassiliicoccales archaeon]|nr:MAG: P-II family nitrogen regulator [Methanomassiliicoccales archaeon]
MKKIEAIVRPEKLNSIKSALEEIGIMGMTVYDVKGRGEQKGLEFTHRAGKYRVDLLSKKKIEIIVEDGKADVVINKIIESAKTGEIGDGKIFVTTVERVIRIRTGETIKN